MEKIHQSLRDSAIARWIALGLISLTMFFAYFFVDVAAPLQSLLERDHSWSPETFGMLGGSEFFLNVFAFFLILSGIILDKMGIRFTMITSGLAMVIGGAIKYFALTQAFADSSLAIWLDSFWVAVPASAKLAFFGFAIFGVGVEMAGITVSKTIVKWFKGKELALAMGLEMAVARLGVFAVFRLSPILAEKGGVPNSIFWGVAFLLVGFMLFFIYTFMDRALDKEMGDASENEQEEPFRISDIWLILKNPGFLAIASLCVLFYSAIFPFQKFATDMLSSRLDISIKDAAAMFSFFPIGAMVLTPFIGAFLDRKGLGATMMLYGAILLTVSHLIFALVPAAAFTPIIAYATIVILGLAFSLVPASMWPSIPKIVEERFLGSAYGLTFWIQNIGLLAVPILIGWALTTSNPGVGDKISNIGKINAQIEHNSASLYGSIDKLESTLDNFQSEFSDGIFTEEHKNTVFPIFYLNIERDKIAEAVTMLNQQFAFETHRTNATNISLESLHKFEQIFRDSSFLNSETGEILELTEKLRSDMTEMQTIVGEAKYNYTVPELIFAGFGVLAMIMSVVLIRVDKKKGFGLDLPNKAK